MLGAVLGSAATTVVGLVGVLLRIGAHAGREEERYADVQRRLNRIEHRLGFYQPDD